MKRILLAAALVLLVAAPSWGFGFGFGFGTWFGGKARAQWVDLVQSLGWSTPTHNFGSKDVGTSATTTFTVTNSGNDTAEDVTTKVTGGGFSLYSSTTFGNISAARTRTAKVRFTPAGNGAFTGFASYSAPNIARVSVALSGTGTGGAPVASASPSTLDYGNVDTGTTSTLTATLTNTGTADLVVGAPSIAGTDAAKFSISSDACNAATVNPSADCLESVMFTPGETAGGPYTASLEFPHNAAGTPTVVALSGTGVTPAVACNSTPTVTYTGGGTIDTSVGDSANRSKVGVFYADVTTYSICAIDIELKVGAGDISSKSYVAKAYSAATANSSLGTLLGTSDAVSGSTITGTFAYIPFTFPAAVNFPQNAVIVVQPADGAADAANYATLRYGAGIAGWQSLHSYQNSGTHYENIGAKTLNMKIYTTP